MKIHAIVFPAPGQTKNRPMSVPSLNRRHSVP